MKVVEVEPEDTIILRSKDWLSVESKIQIQSRLKDCFSNKIVILDGGLSIEVYRRSND